MNVWSNRASYIVGGCAAFAFLMVMALPAHAVTCSSVCNQVRRACNHSAKGVFKVGKIQCDEDLEFCYSQCAVDDELCPGECDAAQSQCRVDNKAARDALRAVCDDFRTICGDSCVEVEGTCVRGCTNDEHGCRKDAKRAEVLCKKSCPQDGSRRTCIRTCRKTNNLDQQLCEDTAVLCYAGCAGVDLTPPATSP